MNACIFDIKRFAVHDGPGIRVTVFFKGCAMHCSWCHNPEGIDTSIETFQEEKQFDGVVLKEELVVGRLINHKDLLNEIEKEKIFMEESGGGVTLSGGEPLLQHNFVELLLIELKNLGIHTCIDTSGYVPANIISVVAKKADLFLYDLKLMDEDQHRYYTGVSNTLILNNLKILNDQAASVTIRFALIPGINDHPGHLDQIIAFLKDLSNIRTVDVIPFHQYARSKYKKFGKPFHAKSIMVPSDQQVEDVRSVFRKAGFICTV
jgi:pyruvate formate lyase activating enzyme